MQFPYGKPFLIKTAQQKSRTVNILSQRHAFTSFLAFHHIGIAGSVL